MSLKLFYFPGRGRAEQVRYLLKATNTPFEDLRVGNPADGQGDFGSMPVLHDGDFRLAQAPVIGAYLARKLKLVDASNLQVAAKLDSIAWAAEDLRMLYFKNAGGSDADKQGLLEKINNRWLPNFEKALAGGPYFAGQNHATHADYAIFDVLSTIAAHPSFAAFELGKHANLQKHYTTISQVPAIADWIKSRPASNF